MLLILGLKEVGNDFVFGFIQAMDGEKVCLFLRQLYSGTSHEFAFYYYNDTYVYLVSNYERLSFRQGSTRISN